MNFASPGQVDNRFTQWLTQRADARTQEMVEEIQGAMKRGEFAGTDAATAPNYAGGVNYCPNSDFRYSKMAAETAAIVPATAGDTNHECYRWYRQTKNSNLTLDAAHALKGATHSLYAANEGANAKLPVWNRDNGWLEIGSIDDAEQYDVAAQLYNMNISAGETWHIRFALRAADNLLIPSDLQAEVGFWHKTGSSEGYIEGGLFTLTRVCDTPGSTTDEYKCIAENDSGLQIESEVLIVTDSPDTLSPIAYNKILFPGGTGYNRFRLYRKRAGNYHLVADIRNTSNLEFNDVGDVSFPVTIWETVAAQNITATARSTDLQIGLNGQSAIYNDFTIYVDPGYDASQSAAYQQFLRIGLKGVTGSNRQIILDKVWCGRTFNQWADSPSDNFPSIPSTSAVTGVPTTGGSDRRPPGAGLGGCILVDYPVLRLDFESNYEWKPYKDIPLGDFLESGLLEKNVVRSHLFTRLEKYLVIRTECGIELGCSFPHRLIRHLSDRSGVAASDLKPGDLLLCWDDGYLDYAVVASIHPIHFPAIAGTFALIGDNNFYVAGRSYQKRNRGLFNRNSKPFPE